MITQAQEPTPHYPHQSGGTWPAGTKVSQHGAGATPESDQLLQTTTQHNTINLAEYAPLDDPANVKRLTTKLEELQQQGVERVMSVIELGTVNYSNPALLLNESSKQPNPVKDKATFPFAEVDKNDEPDKQAETGSEAVASFESDSAAEIPEIAELERLLAAVPEGDTATVRVVIKDWVRHLSNPTLRIRNDDSEIRRRRKEVEAEEVVVCEWVKRLNILFLPLTQQNIHLAAAEKEYGIPTPVISRWKGNQYLDIRGQEKNKLLLGNKSVAIASTIHQRFGGSGKKLVGVAMRYYKSLQP